LGYKDSTHLIPTQTHPFDSPIPKTLLSLLQTS
jgi:hypothetical protein